MMWFLWLATVLFASLAAFLRFYVMPRSDSFDVGMVRVFAVIALLIGVSCGVPAVGGHKLTGEGEYNGYVVSVETSGVLFYNTGAYLKTDAEATAGETFCVLDDSVKQTLRDLATSGGRVRVQFERYWVWADGCHFQSSKVITAVERL